MPAKPKPAKRRKARTPQDGMKSVYRDLVKANGPASVVDWGDMGMTYLGEGVYLKADGTMHSE